MTSERLPDWTGFKTIAKCYPSATWERSIGNLEVVKFQIDRHFYVGSVAGRHYIIGSPSRLKRLSAACALCLNPKVLLWVTGQKEPPDTWEGLGLGEGGSLVIAQESAHVSPKAWRQIRSKLHFTIWRWQQPTNREISDWATKEQVWVRAPKPGHAKNDGSTVFVHPNRAGVAALSEHIWSLSYSGFLTGNMHLGACLNDPDWSYYVVCSSFRVPRDPH